MEGGKGIEGAVMSLERLIRLGYMDKRYGVFTLGGSRGEGYVDNFVQLKLFIYN